MQRLSARHTFQINLPIIIRQLSQEPPGISLVVTWPAIDQEFTMRSDKLAVRYHVQGSSLLEHDQAAVGACRAGIFFREAGVSDIVQTRSDSGRGFINHFKIVDWFGHYDW